MTQNNHDVKNPLAQPLDLPCGVQLKNRFIKSAMSDSLGDGAGTPPGHRCASMNVGRKGVPHFR